jgi:hypothetical protein
VLEPNEKAAFDGMVTRLRDDDPRFSHRVDRLCRPRGRLYLIMAVLLWMIAPICIVFGGWTGVLMAAVAGSYGAYLMTKRGRSAGETIWSSTRRPRTSSS